MATRSTTHLYDTYAQATAVVRNLEAAGFPAADISIISSHADDRVAAASAEPSGAGTGAAIGGVVGGGAGLLAGLGMMAIPGIGPIVAAGWLASTALGAATGAAGLGLIGALADAGVDERDAHVYAEGVRRGGTLVTLRYDDAREDAALAVMRGGDPVDAVERGTLLREDGWTQFDERGLPYPGRRSTSTVDAPRNIGT